MRFNATSSLISSTTANIVGSNLKFTVVVWLRAITGGEGTQGRILVLDETGNAIGVLITGGSILQLSRTFSGGTRSCGLSNSGSIWELGKWFCVAFTYDATSVSNDAVMYISKIGADGGLIPRTLTTNSGTTGTATTPASGFAIGNRANLDRTWDGDIAYLQAFTRILTISELNDCMTKPGKIRKDRALYAPLIETPYVFDANGKRFASTTVSAVSKNGGPPGIREYKHRRSWLGFVPTGGTLQSLTGSRIGSLARLRAGTISTLIGLTGSRIRTEENNKAGSVTTSINIAGAVIRSEEKNNAGSLSLSYTINGDHLGTEEKVNAGSIAASINLLGSKAGTEERVFQNNITVGAVTLNGVFIPTEEVVRAGLLDFSTLLSGSRITSEEKNNPASITTGAVSLLGVLIRTEENFRLNSLLSTIDILGSRIAPTGTVRAGSVSAMINLAGAYIVTGEAVRAGLVQAGSVSLAGSHAGAEDVVRTGIITVNTANILGSRILSEERVTLSTVQLGNAFLYGVKIASGETFYTANISLAVIIALTKISVEAYAINYIKVDAPATQKITVKAY